MDYVLAFSFIYVLYCCLVLLNEIMKKKYDLLKMTTYSQRHKKEEIKRDYSYEIFINYFKRENKRILASHPDAARVFPMMTTMSSTDIECMLELIDFKDNTTPSGMLDLLIYDLPVMVWPGEDRSGFDTQFSRFKQNFYERHPDFLLKKRYEARFLKMEQMLAAINDKINILAELMDKSAKKDE